MLGSPVAVTGTWIRDRIDVSGLSSCAVRAESNQAQAPCSERDTARKIASRFTAHTAERPLWDAGSLLWRVAFTDTDGRLRVRVAAHDPDVVRRALEPVYGTSLEVVPSPWGRETYAQVDGAWALAERRGLLFALTREMCEDGVVRVTMGLTRVTDELAAALDAIPDGPLALDVMVRHRSAEDADHLSQG